MATQSIRNFTQATGRNLGGLSANTARRPDLPFLPSMGMPKPAPAMAPPPGGRLVPGRSGSMVWQRDSLPTTTPTPPPSSGSAFDSPPSTPEPAPAPSFDNSPLSGDMGLGKPLGSPLSFDLPPLGAPLGSNARADSPLAGDMGLGKPLGSPLSFDRPPLGAPLGSNAPADSPLAGDMGLGKPLEFGGYRAKGGPVRPGAAYVVGEQAPELFVPDRPGQIVPMGQPPLNRAAPPVNPVNQYQDRINRQKDQSLSEDAAFWDQQKTDWNKSANNWQGFMLQEQEDRSNLPVGSPEWLAANQRADASWANYADAVAGVERTGKFAQEARSQIGTGQGWKDHVGLDALSQQRAEQRMAEMRAQRAQRPGGADFVGPLQPRPAPVQPAPSPPNVPTGMLVPSSSGGVKWQPGTGPGTTLPPQSGGASAPPSMMPAAPPLPFAMPAQRAAYVNTGSGLDRAVSTGLAGAPRRQVGRSANDPTRIAEQMRRRGDPRAILQFGMQQMGQDFARERDAVNFAQSQMMFGQQQQAMDARDARNFDQGLMMFGLQQGGADARDVRNFQQQRQIAAERFMAEQAAQEAARKRVPMMGQVPIPGTNYMGTYADGRYMGNVPMAKPDAPLPPGMEPTEANRGGVKYRPKETPSTKIPEGIQYEKDDTGKIIGGVYPAYNDQGKLVMRRIDMDGDGVVSPTEQAAAQTGVAGGSATGAPTSASANDFAGQTKNGFSFQLAK